MSLIGTRSISGYHDGFDVIELGHTALIAICLWEMRVSVRSHIRSPSATFCRPGMDVFEIGLSRIELAMIKPKQFGLIC